MAIIWCPEVCTVQRADPRSRSAARSQSDRIDQHFKWPPYSQARGCELVSEFSSTRASESTACCYPIKTGSHCAVVGLGFAPSFASRDFAIASVPSRSMNGKMMLPLSCSASL